MVLLNSVRCHYCTAEVTGDNWNDTLNRAEDAGWLIWERFDDDPRYLCPEHHTVDAAGNMSPVPPEGEEVWRVDCVSCDWEESFDSEVDARHEAMMHECSDHLDPWVNISGPDDLRAEKERRDKAMADVAKRKDAEKLQRRKEEAEQQRLRAFADLGERYQQMQERYPRLIWGVYKIDQIRSSDLIERLLRYTRRDRGDS